MRPGFSLRRRPRHPEFIKNLLGFYVIMEGIFFYSGFVVILSLHRQSRMTGIGEQFQYILRDETVHMNFSIDLTNTIKVENPEAWTPELRDELSEMISEAVEHEIAYARECLSEGVLGLNDRLFREHVRFVADHRLGRIGLPARYGFRNTFPWMSETMDLDKKELLRDKCD